MGSPKCHSSASADSSAYTRAVSAAISDCHETATSGKDVCQGDKTQPSVAAERRRKLVDHHWKLALVVHGTEQQAHAAGCYPYGEDRDETDSDIPLFCAYIATAKELLQDPTVETEGSPAHLKLVELIMALRKYAAHVTDMPDLMVEVASSDLEVLAAMEGLAMDLASGDLDDMMGSEGRGEAGSEDCTESGSERESNVGESTEGSTVDDFDHGHGEKPSYDAAAILPLIGMTATQERMLLVQHKRVRAALADVYAERPKLRKCVRKRGAAAKSASAALRANLQREGYLIAKLVIWTTQELLDPIQHARLDTSSFPLLPDPLAIGDLLLDRQRDAACGPL
mmetsp:Transcript_15107/g.45615  ORF Transcript_15107/g.45615 Transcript_15107/m.45615 type:complete len:340 (+) Transcript_15107:557-1576(+)